jgi:predicted transglutaminase-like cysteine proteinase
MWRSVKVLLFVGIIAASLWMPHANATFYGLPRSLKSQMDLLSFDVPSLAPMAFTRFCLQYPVECRAPSITFRPRKMALTPERWADLVRVTREVNRSIVPQRNEAGILAEEWLLSPRAGDCNDYAVTKRHALMARGWPSRSLALTEVVVPSGEHHLVLVARTADGDFVLDNLTYAVRPVSKTPYQWVRAQSPRNPKFWSMVSVTTLFRAPIPGDAARARRSLRAATLALSDSQSEDSGQYD